MTDIISLARVAIDAYRDVGQEHIYPKAPAERVAVSYEVFREKIAAGKIPELAGYSCPEGGFYGRTYSVGGKTVIAFRGTDWSDGDVSADLVHTFDGVGTQALAAFHYSRSKYK